jgi:hypothetical protein
MVVREKIKIGKIESAFNSSFIFAPIRKSSIMSSSFVQEITGKCKEALMNDKSNQKVEAIKNYISCLEIATKGLKSLKSKDPKIGKKKRI